MPNIGVVGPDGDNPSFPTDPHIPGWSGRWPSALALDAKGWAAVLWGNPRNLWRWWPTWLADGEDIDGMSRSLMDGWRREGMGGPACVDVGGWVGVAHFTELWGFDGADINEAAGRVLGIPPDWTQWLGGSKNRHGPYCRGWLTGRHLGDVCRMAAEGVHPARRGGRSSPMAWRSATTRWGERAGTRRPPERPQTRERQRRAVRRTNQKGSPRPPVITEEAGARRHVIAPPAPSRFQYRSEYSCCQGCVSLWMFVRT